MSPGILLLQHLRISFWDNSYFLIVLLLSKEACENESCHELHSNDEKKAIMAFRLEPMQFKWKQFTLLRPSYFGALFGFFYSSMLVESDKQF